MREDDRPPEWMWPFPEDLEEHFEQIRWARESGNERDEVLRNEY